LDWRLIKTTAWAAVNTAPSASSFNIWSIGNALHNFNWVIDEVRIYNRALSEFEITSLYGNSR
jgi:hypothetical protein